MAQTQIPEQKALKVVLASPLEAQYVYEWLPSE
jgi:hypothetical protein